MRALAALLLFTLPALAQGGGSGGGAPPMIDRTTQLERLRIARRAFDARMKLADMLREDSKPKEALAAYGTALAMFDSVLAAESPEPERLQLGGAPALPGRPRVRAGAHPRIELGLRWLADHQDEDGRFDAKGFMKHDPAEDKCDGDGAATMDTGATGIALLAFLGAGYTDRGESPYTNTVRKGLRFLITSQAPDGSFGPRDAPRFLLNHAIATLALCEAYAMTKNPRYWKPATDGVSALLKARDARGGWGKDADVQMDAWCLMALESMHAADPDFEAPWNEIDEAAVRRVNKWTDGDGRVAGDPWREGALALRFPVDKVEATTAAGTWMRVLAGEDPGRSDAVTKGVALCVAKPPLWNPSDGSIDMHYWYFGTLALARANGAGWRTWSDAMERAILDHQHGPGAGARTGSWDPLDPFGAEGGRIYSTALMTLCLEIYNRQESPFRAGNRKEAGR